MDPIVVATSAGAPRFRYIYAKDLAEFIYREFGINISKSTLASYRREAYQATGQWLALPAPEGDVKTWWRTYGQPIHQRRIAAQAHNSTNRSEPLQSATTDFSI